MKPFIYSFIFIFTLTFTAYANDWSHIEGSYADKTPYLAAKVADKNKTIFTYCTYAKQTKNAQYTNEELSIHVRAAFKRWTLGIAYALKSHPRAAEFKDIIDLLSIKRELKNDGICNLDKLKKGESYEGQSDIAIVYDENFCNIPKGFSGFFQSAPAPYICISEEPANTYRSEKTKQCLLDYVSTDKTAYDCFSGMLPKEGTLFNAYQSILVITHEMGHAFGLDDEYKANKQRSKKQASKKRGKGIMSRKNPDINLDDIEGLITLLDKAENTSRTIQPSLAWKNGAVKDGMYYKKEDLIKQLKQTKKDDSKKFLQKYN